MENNKPEFHLKAILLVHLSSVKKLRWSLQDGQILKTLRLRQKLTRKEVISLMKHPNPPSDGWLSKIELGKTDTIDVDLLLDLLSALGTDFSILYKVNTFKIIEKCDESSQ